MTVLCGGGTSSPKSPFGATIAVGASGMAALLNNIPTPWAVPLAGYLGLLTYDLSTFCATDPPAIPTITAGDVAALLTVSDPVGHLAAQQKFQNLVAAFLWCQVCQCDSGSIPSCGSAPAAPAGMPQINPPLATGLPQSATPVFCWDSGIVTTSATSLTEITARIAVPVGLYYTVEVIGTHATAPCTHFNGALAFSAAPTGAPAGYYGVTGVIPFDTTIGPTTAISSTQQYCSIAVSTGGATACAQSGRVIVCFYDTPQVNIQQNCGCPPDPIILGLLHNIQDMVTLLQRQGLPFAYQNGAVHSGVSGSGEISVSQLLGAKFSPSSIPPDAGQVAGDPDELWLDSWYTWGNADGWREREFLRHSPQISLPANCQLYTKLGYSFRPGLTVDVQELERES